MKRRSTILVDSNSFLEGLIPLDISHRVNHQHPRNLLIPVLDTTMERVLIDNVQFWKTETFKHRWLWSKQISWSNWIPIPKHLMIACYQYPSWVNVLTQPQWEAYTANPPRWCWHTTRRYTWFRCNSKGYFLVHSLQITYRHRQSKIIWNGYPNKRHLWHVDLTLYIESTRNLWMKWKNYLMM